MLPSLLIAIETAVEEVEIGLYVFVIAIRLDKRIALVVDSYIEWLCVSAELMALQIAPLVAHCAQYPRLSLLLHLDVFGQRCLVVDEQRYEHVVLGEPIGHLGIGPYGGFHLPTVHATEPCKVDKYRLSLRFSSRHALLVV